MGFTQWGGSDPGVRNATAEGARQHEDQRGARLSAEEAEQRAAQLQAVLAAISDIVLVYDTDGHIVFINDAATGQVGIEATPEAIKRLGAGLQAMELYRPDGRPIADGERLRPRALRGEVIVGEEMMYRPLTGGPVRWVRASAGPVRGRDGQIAGAVVTAADITAQREAENERDRLLREAQATRENLRIILDRLPDGVLVVDQAQQVTVANEAVWRFVGRDVAGVLLPELRRVHGFVMPDGRPFPPGQTPIERTLRGETVAGVEVRIQRLDGHTVEALESCAPLYDAQGRLTGAVVALTDITALREAEAERERLLAEVERTQHYLQTLLNRLPDGVAVVDPSLHVVLANEASRRLLARDITGMTIAEMDREFQLLGPTGQPLPPEERPVQRVRRGEAASGMEMRVPHPDGSAVDLLVGAAPLYDHDLSTLVLTLTDITARKQAEIERERLLGEVQSVRGKLQAVLDDMPDVVLAFDRELRLTMCNNRLRQYLEREPVGMTLPELLRGVTQETPDGRPFPREQSPLRRALAGESASGLEMGVRLDEGRRLVVQVSAAPIYETRGGQPAAQPTGAVLTLTDVTARKEAEAERERLLAQVEEARRALRTIIDQLPDTVLVVDADGWITLSNRAARRYARCDLARMQLYDAERELDFRQADGQPFPEGQTPVARALRGESVVGAEASVGLTDGQRHDMLKSAAPVLGPDGTVREVAAVLTDVTALKELDRAKDQFISVAAHELRTPLAALKGHAQMLLRRAERMSWALEDRRSLQAIDSQVDRLNDLIGRLLNVSRIRLGRLQLNREPTDIVALARQVVEELQVTAEAHRITIDAAPAANVGNWDPAALRQVLTNLVGNAIRYAVPGPIDVHIWQEGHQAMVSVTDYGPGIPPERQAHLFEAFRPSAAEEFRKGGGLGLGLYISRGIVEAHGGHIAVESQVGVGSTFTFSLPLDGRG